MKLEKVLPCRFKQIKKDTEHVFKASKHGGDFVTTGERITKMKPDLERIYSATIVKSSELLHIMLVSVSLATVDEWCLNDEKKVHLLER